MNKRTLRSFSLGMLFATILFFAGDKLLHEEIEPVDEGNTVVVAKEEWEQMKANLNDKEKELEKLQAQLNEKIEESPTEVESPDQDETEKEQTTEAENNEAVSFQLNIEKGMTSEVVAEILEREQIIQDKVAFSKFLFENGYSRKIQLGTFELNSQMSFEEISQIITKR